MANPDDRVANEGCSTCSGCGQHTAPVWSLGHHQFCDDCVRSAGFDPTERRNSELQEQVDWPFGSGFVRALASALTMSLMIGFGLTVAFLAINVFFALTKQQPFQQHLLKTIQVVPLFFGFGVAFISVVSIPLMLIFNWTMRPNRIDVEGDELVVRSSLRRRRFPVREIVWCVTTHGSDMSGFYWPGHRLIQVTYTAGPQQADAMVCGFTDESFLMWCEFLSLMRAKRHEPIGLRVFSQHMFVGTLCGSILGVCIGKSFDLFLLNPMWIVAWGFLGFLDGVLVGILNAGLETGFQTKKNWLRQFGKGWQGVAFGAVTGAALGVKSGIIAGLPGVAVCSSFNAVFCGFLMVHFWKRLTASAKSDEFVEAVEH